jgi:DNA-binding ferritin-like protein
MNTRVLLILSLLVNAALAGWLLVGPRFTESEHVSLDGVPVKADAAIDKPAEAAAALALGARVVTITNAAATLDWRAVESADYKQYIANLRAIGCPEKTIRDIITADVNELFKEREKQSRAASTNKFQFWKTGMQMFAQAFDEEKIKAEQQLRKEKRDLLTELLGSAPEEKVDLAAAALGGAQLMEQMLDFLPADKQAAVADVIQKYQARMMKDLGQGGFDADSMKDITKIQKEMEGELAKFLTPQEIEDYNLRMSNTANMMRFTLASFEPTEQEFRDIFKQKKEFEDQFGFIPMPPGDKAEREKYDAAKKTMDEQLKQTLGDRYADYERAQDFSYQGIYNVAQRQGLPRQTANQVYDMKKAAEAEAKRVRADTALSQEQRTAALQGIQAETERSIRTTMGDKAFESYQKNPTASWLKNLAPKPVNAVGTTK